MACNAHAQVSFVDVLMLERETLAQVLCLFPISAARLRRITIRLALRRHLVAEARSALNKQENSPMQKASAFFRVDTVTNFEAQCLKQQRRRVSTFLKGTQSELKQGGCTRKSLKRVLKVKQSQRLVQSRPELKWDEDFSYHSQTTGVG